MKPENWQRTALLYLLLWAPATGLAQELYKYVDEDGVTVLDSSVPPKYVRNGYTILSTDGRVIEVVPRALTPAELVERERRQQAEAQAKKEVTDRQAADAALLRLYGTPEDVVRARDTKLASVEGFLTTSKGNLARLYEQKKLLEAAMADIERSGGSMPQENLNRVNNLQSRIEQTQVEINTRTAEIEQLRARFEADRQRLIELQKNLPRKTSSPSAPPSPGNGQP